ncbi:hypothetical protein KQI76_07020 [Amphibacillus sp. MSJ-3]|uniref:hypothetical protein n=1 Tax=Amphibacillus sp. MSJ-3 TaxID=2841505 RepID=UPI001C0EFD2B|nr:hypothetical protein [Amphibacillus sp. MSJ-3]MBU5594912.1 hypothetical protein [Amphibacillus sp. MSJ-3]
MLDRIKIRKPDVDDLLADEFIRTAKDRILLRAGLKKDEFPSELESICVEVVTAMINRHEMNHEGVDSESVDVFSVKFINSLLDEYDQELQSYKGMIDDEEDEKRGVVRFL